MDNKLRETLRSNGEVVLGALKKINTPATLKDVVEYLANTNELDASKIRAPVREILNTGYNLGFLGKRGAKYTLDPEPDSKPDDDHPSDRSRSRSRSRSRRRGSRSRSRKRSRSRRRRRRR